MADDDKLTVRERRAQHAKQQARKDAPKNLVRKAAVPTLVVLVLAGIATGFYFTNKNAQDCPGHFHVTFGFFIPGDNGTFEKVDFVSPRGNGGPYYNFGGGASFSSSVHMHNTAGDALGASQLHIEPPTASTCVPLEDILRPLEVEASNTRLEFKGAHEQVGQAGTWTASGNETVRFFLQDPTGEWSERPFSSFRDRQAPDGSSFLLVFGDYTDAQVDEMKASIPVPASRPAAGATGPPGP